MIDRYTLVVNSNSLNSRFNLYGEIDFEIFNGYPTRKLPVIIDGRINYFYWGNSPEWANNKRLSEKFFNLSLDKISSSSSAKRLLSTNRCIIPITGYYVWRQIGKKKKVPYYNHFEGEIKGVAGVWEKQTDLDENEYFTFKMIIDSTENDDPIPLTISQEHEKEWFSGDNSDDFLINLLRNEPPLVRVTYSVSPNVANIKIDDAQLIKHEPPSDQHGNYTLFEF